VLKKEYIAASIGISMLLLSFSRKHSDETHFVVPNGWPQPYYNFAANPLTNEGIDLGRTLFFDPQLSQDGTISCASCHAPARSFADSKALSEGVHHRQGKRHATPLINLAWSTSFMWDGGVNNLEVQPLNPLTDSAEMGSKLPDVIAKLNASASYRVLFHKVFNDSNVTSQHLLKTLAQYMLTLESYNSKYDRVMQGHTTFTMGEKRGYALFKRHCNSCHTEPLFTNYAFKNNGLPSGKCEDHGRMNITRASCDSLKFKVPTLRNVAATAPYMHDGRFVGLKDAVHHYTSGIAATSTLADELKQPIKLSAEDEVALVQFLNTLTDSTFLGDNKHLPRQL
jgi:cytochrome c peroxidase